MSPSRASNEPSVASTATTTAATTTSLKRKSDDMAWEWEIQHKVNATLRVLQKKKLDKARVHDLLQRQDEDNDVVEEQDICSGGGNRNQGISIGRRKVIDNVRGPLDQLLTTDNMKQSTLDKNNPQKQVLKKKTWLCIAKWAYEVGLPFNAVRPPSFTKMIHAIGEYGRVTFKEEELPSSIKIE
ncbi:hypothetical protein IFM89_031075 [Coptis chinensis]|uniref:Uncharacterized protein n=1 Tax=Coptis chinensis TaxID=261450 RepID=A0A835LXR5_9MAGN|nr:hypothetical protein IFM89_031075 [Coptis chinensis]